MFKSHENPASSGYGSYGCVLGLSRGRASDVGFGRRFPQQARAAAGAVCSRVAAQTGRSGCLPHTYAEELGVPVKVTNVAGGGGWVSWGQGTSMTGTRDSDDHKLAVVNIPHIFSYAESRT